MLPEDVRLVQQSFGLVIPIADTAAALFYGRLFELDPALRPLFRGDMAEQGRKLMTMLRIVVAQLDRWEALRPAVEQLGKRHAGYGVTAEHYATVSAALLWTLEQGLGAAFTPEVRAAWTEAYAALADTMRAAAASEAEPLLDFASREAALAEAR